MDLAQRVSREKNEGWDGGPWTLGAGYAGAQKDGRPHVVAIDYGSKDNIFRNLVKAGAGVTVVPAKTSFEDIMALKPDGVFLSNGPGDPAATGEYAVPVIKQLLEAGVPIFGICLGHQMLAIAAGAKTVKMHQGHRGANHPVQRVGGVWDATEDLVEITSMNHGFAVDGSTLPEGVIETHRLAVRRLQLRDFNQRQEGVRRAVPPRGITGTAGQLLPVRKVCGDVGVTTEGPETLDEISKQLIFEICATENLDPLAQRMNSAVP